MIIQTMRTPSGGFILLGRYSGSISRRARVDDKGKVTFREPDPTGLTGTFFTTDGYNLIRTPHGDRVIRARRAKNKVAKLARRRNR